MWCLSTINSSSSGMTFGLHPRTHLVRKDSNSDCTSWRRRYESWQDSIICPCSLIHTGNNIVALVQQDIAELKGHMYSYTLCGYGDTSIFQLWQAIYYSRLVILDYRDVDTTSKHHAGTTNAIRVIFSLIRMLGFASFRDTFNRHLFWLTCICEIMVLYAVYPHASDDSFDIWC